MKDMEREIKGEDLDKLINVILENGEK